MSRAVEERLGVYLDAAESEMSCFVPTERKDRQALERRVRRNTVVEPVPGLFSRASTWAGLEPEERALSVMRGLARRHPEWVFCGPSAALVHGLEISYRRMTRTYVATTRLERASDSPGVRRVTVRERPCETVRGLRVTEFWETVFGCISHMPFPEALAVADSALRARRLDWAQASALLSERFAGRPRLRRVLAVLAWADGLSENGGESIARAQMIRMGFEPPELQREFDDPYDPGRVFRVDFVWADAAGRLVFGELDGGCKTTSERCLRGRTPAEVLAESQERETRLTFYRAAFVRFTMAEVALPEVFARKLEIAGVPRGERPPQRAGVPMRRDAPAVAGGVVVADAARA